jgi:hypothetical protein
VHLVVVDRVNPGRRIEGTAVDLIQASIGALGHVVNTGTGHGPDFRVDYTNGRAGIGEVTWHEDPDFRGMWEALVKRGQQLPLDGDVGQWSVHLNTGARVARAMSGCPTSSPGTRRP